MENGGQNTGVEPDNSSGSESPLLPPMLPADEGKHTLVLDMDGTLLREYDAERKLTFNKVHVDRDLFLQSQSTGARTFVSKRPFLEDFLLNLQELYEIVIFTESSKRRADVILDNLIEGQCIRHRLYRDSCTEVDGRLAKDLSRLGRDLSKVILMDDCPFSYVLQRSNALPIPTFHAGLDDLELRERQCFLTQVLKWPKIDVRTVLTEINMFDLEPEDGSPSGEVGLRVTPGNVLRAPGIRGPLLPRMNPCDLGKPTLVLDMDFTILCQTVQPHKLSNRFSHLEYEYCGAPADVYLRPGLEEFLAKMEEVFEIVVFTASPLQRAHKLVPMLDKRGCIRFRLGRNACIELYQRTIKDLSRLGRDIRRVVLIDDTPSVYELHPYNAIPISPFWGQDEEDSALTDLLPFLTQLSQQDDVRPLIQHKYHNDDIVVT